MTKDRFLDAMGALDADLILECLDAPPRAAHPARRWLRAAAAVAACAALAAGVFFWRRQPPPGPDDASARLAEAGFTVEDGVLLAYTGEAETVVIPDAVTEIAAGAFRQNGHAGQITAVRLGSSVRRVAADAFAGLSALSELTVDAENPAFAERDGMLLSADGTLLVRYSGTGGILRIPQSVRMIGAHACQNAALETVIFPDELVYIGFNAFADCRSLTEIALPASVHEIAEGAFAGCMRAVDGTVPPDAWIGAGAFENVPFYLTMLAGEMSPLEAVVRGAVTPSEAIARSDAASLLRQMEEILAFYHGTGTGEGSFAYGAIAEAPPLPEGMRLPETVDLRALRFSDSGWGKTGIYDVQIAMTATGGEMCMEAYFYAPGSVLHWRDARWRIARIYFIADAAETAAEEAGWRVTMEQDGEMYVGMTFLGGDGRMVHASGGHRSEAPYRILFSPDGTRCAVEYYANGETRLYVQSLIGERFEVSQNDYLDYLNRYFGAYVPGELSWESGDVLCGRNVNGRFRWDFLHEVYPAQAEE